MKTFYKKFRKRFCVVCLVFVFVGTLVPWPKKMQIIVPTASVTHESDESGESEWNTQVLFGENLIAYEEKEGHLRIGVPDQEVSSRDGEWIACPGWIPSEAAIEVVEFQDHDLVVCGKVGILFELNDSMKSILLSFGTKLQGMQTSDDYESELLRFVLLPDGKEGFINASFVKALEREYEDEDKLDELRQSICESAKLFVDKPYRWGGRSWQESVDCSGLAGLCYQAHGVKIPRNSRCQYKKSEKITSGLKLKPADLIFISKKIVPEKICHVMMYLGDDQFIEAAGRSIRKVVIRTGKEVLGKPIEEVVAGELTDYGTIYFGGYLTSS